MEKIGEIMINEMSSDDYFKWRSENGLDGPDLSENNSGSHHCIVVSSTVGVEEIDKKMISICPRACSLLEEALDWVGAINLTDKEEALAQNLQHRIARLLAESRI